MRLIDFFDTAAEYHPQRTAVIDGDVHLSFGELQALSARLAAALGPPGARVAIISPNDYRVLVCTLGAMRAGAALVPVHARDEAEAQAGFLNRVQPQWVFYHSGVASIPRVKRQLTQEATWICLDRTDGDDVGLATLLDEALEHLPEWADAYGSPTQLAYIWQTSGSTGSPKIVVNDIGASAATHAVFRQVLKTESDAPVCLVVSPLSHAAGVHAFSTLTLGATVVVVREFDAGEVLRSIPRHQVTHLWLPPTALYLLLESAESRRVDTSTLESVVLGAAGVSPARLRQAVEVFGPCINVHYAQIEAGFLTWLDSKTVAAAVAGHHPERLRSSGTSLYVSQLAILSDAGQRLPPGAHGEIVVRGRSVKPYLDAHETARAQRHGWHHTGDVGYFDTDGFLYVVGRTKDNINTRGFKVAASEVETALLEIADIQECAVVGVPDELRGERVAAAVTLRSGSRVTIAEIVQHCRKRLGRVKAPGTVVRWETLPKSAVGKVDKQAVRRRLLEGSPTVRSVAIH